MGTPRFAKRKGIAPADTIDFFNNDTIDDNNSNDSKPSEKNKGKKKKKSDFKHNINNGTGKSIVKLAVR